MQVYTFYNGLSDSTRTIIDASTGGALMKKTTDQAYGIREDMATNSNQWPRDRMILRKAGGGANTEVLSNLVSLVAQLTKQLQRQQGVVNAIQANPLGDMLTMWGTSQHYRMPVGPDDNKTCPVCVKI